MLTHCVIKKIKGCQPEPVEGGAVYTSTILLQYFDKLSMTMFSMTESCQPEPVEGGPVYTSTILRQYFDKLSMTILSMTMLSMTMLSITMLSMAMLSTTEGCQPEPVEGGPVFGFISQLHNGLIL